MIFFSPLYIPLVTVFSLCVTYVPCTLIKNSPLFQLKGVEDGGVDPGPTTARRCPPPDAISVRSALSN